MRHEVARPLTSVTDWWKYSSCWRGRDVRDRQISVRHVADELGIWKTSLYEVISDHFEMKKVFTKWKPKLLTQPQRDNRVDCSEELLKNCKQDPTEFFDRIVTGNETWIHHHNPLSQQEAKTWKKPGEKTPTRPRVTQSPSQDHHDHLLGLWRCSSQSIFYHMWYYNQWSILRITPSPAYVLLFERNVTGNLGVWCAASSRQRTCSQVQHHTGCYSVHKLHRIESSRIFSRYCTQQLSSVLKCEEFSSWSGILRPMMKRSWPWITVWRVFILILVFLR